MWFQSSFEIFHLLVLLKITFCFALENGQKCEEKKFPSFLTPEKFRYRIEQTFPNVDFDPPIRDHFKRYKELTNSKSVQENQKFDMVKKSVNIERCNCVKDIWTSSTENNAKFEYSTCSEVSAERGFGQKIVSYSFYSAKEAKNNKEADKLYFPGIFANLLLMKKFYPGWTMR